MLVIRIVNADMGQADFLIKKLTYKNENAFVRSQQYNFWFCSFMPSRDSQCPVWI